LALLSTCGDEYAGPDNPIPTITSITPSAIAVGAPGTTLAISGTGFVTSSQIHVNNSARPTQFINATSLQATLSAGDASTPTRLDVVVVNRAPGGGTSAAAVLVVGEPTAPVPAITSLTPSSVIAGGGTQEVVVSGSGFTPQTVAVITYLGARETTYLSSTRLSLRIMGEEAANADTLDIRLHTPAPGGGTSNVLPLEVRNPRPSLSSLGASRADAGQVNLTLTLSGSGFVRTSVGKFAGSARPTVYTTANSLSITLGESDLRAAGTFPITVENPSPGGGNSAALSLTLVVGAPQLSLLPSRGATAGRTGFTLTVHGDRFVPGSVVRWNGTTLPTTYIGANRIAAVVSTALVATPTQAQISVSTPGAGTSTASPFTVRTLGAATANIRTVQVASQDLVYDSARARLYATVAATSTVQPNAVIAIDPLTGSITDSVFAGPSPYRIERSGDGRFLYVGVNGANAIQRFDLPSLTPDVQWPLGINLVAGDIEVLPGLPNVVAVARYDVTSSPPLAGVTIYDNGVARPKSSPGHTGGNRIAVLEAPGVVYGFNNSSSGWELFEIAVDHSGARHASTTPSLIRGFTTDIVGVDGRIYATDGSVVDAERRTKVGAFPVNCAAFTVDPVICSAITVDAETGRAYMLVTGAVQVYDLNTFQLLGTINVPGYSLAPFGAAFSRLVRWGADGLAFRDREEIFIVRSPVVAP
jgi:hypothetical protein